MIVFYVNPQSKNEIFEASESFNQVPLRPPHLPALTMKLDMSFSSELLQ